MTKEVLISLISVAVGAGLTLLSTIGYDFIKERRERVKLIKVIYVDVQNNLTSLYTGLRDLPYDIAQNKDFIYGCDFDLRFFDSYSKEISLLSPIDTARVMSFYGELAKANEVKNILKDRNNNLTSEDRKRWINFMYEKMFKSTRNGRRIMSDFEKKYKIKPLGDVKKTMDAYEEQIVLRNPDLKSKLRIPEGSL